MLLPLSVSVPWPWSYGYPLSSVLYLLPFPTGTWALWEKETISRSSFNTISPSYGSDIPKEFHAISHTDENQVLLKIKWGYNGAFFSNSQKLTYFFYLSEDSYNSQYGLGKMFSGYPHYCSLQGQPRKQGSEVEFLPISIRQDKFVSAEELCLAHPSPCLSPVHRTL